MSPLTGDNPSGVDLRHDERFAAIERLLDPQPEVVLDSQRRAVGTTVPPVDWDMVQSECEALLRTSRDLRLMVILTRALIGQEGLSGAAEGVELIARSVEQHWGTLYPALRPAGPPADAAIRRLNALRELESDRGALADLRRVVLFKSRPFAGQLLEPVSAGEIADAARDSNTVESETPRGLSADERAQILAEHERLVDRVCFLVARHAEADAEGFAAARAAAEGLAGAVRSLEAAVGAQLGGNGAGLRLPALDSFLERLVGAFDLPPGDAAPAEGAAEQPAPASPGGGAAPARGTAAGLPSGLESRADIERCLDLVISYYARHEPSSPIPHLVQRVRRMVPMDFVALMEELSPQGLREFRALAGMEDERALRSDRPTRPEKPGLAREPKPGLQEKG
ncbi:MAG TPA: type VI secretion system ImpA family N-terminal domain-containing protein [Thermohalobaculum sp.]|nr:type VI secretion system ImpA family N-terminal domain-containing protein [Thermohalobaculum sp.]